MLRATNDENGTHWQSREILNSLPNQRVIHSPARSNLVKAAHPTPDRTLPSPVGCLTHTDLRRINGTFQAASAPNFGFYPKSKFLHAKRVRSAGH